MRTYLRYSYYLSNKEVTDAENYIARFIVKLHKVREKEFIIHISRAVKHENNKLLISVGEIYKMKFWNKES